MSIAFNDVAITILLGAIGSGLFALIIAVLLWRLDFSRRSLRKYLRAVAKEHEYLDMIDLHRQIRLEDIYVTLKMARKVRKPVMPGEEDDRGARSEHRVWRDRGERGMVEQLEEVRLENVLKEKSIVFRGDPGAGKTTLLRHLTYTYSTKDEGKRPIPIFVRLADLSGDRFNCNLDAWLQHYYPKQTHLLNERLQNGECIILLDGLDEVKRESWDGVRSEALRLANWKNQVILSCRSAAYSEGFMPAQFKLYEVVGFSEKQQRQFLDKWFEGKPGKAGTLCKALKSNPRMREFTQNPLLLSLAAVVCENDPAFQLPMQRIDLYREATELLMRRWNEKRVPGQKPKFDKGDKREFLEEMAFDYFVKGEEIFQERDLLNRIRSWQEERGRFTDGKRREVLEELSAHNGFLVRQSDNQYRFLHLTFQEYFTACALHRRGESVWRELVVRYVWHPRWEEVIRLLGSLLDDASPLISLIWNPDVEDDIFGSRLLLAGRCLGDVREVGELWMEIADGIWDLTGHGVSSIRAAASEAYGLLTRRYPESLDRFWTDLKAGDSLVRWSAASALGAIGSEDVVRLLIQMLKDGNSYVRLRAADALGTTGSKEAVRPLIKMLKDRDSYVCWSAADALGAIGSEEAVIPLIQMLKDKHEDSLVRRNAADALGAIGSEEAVVPLIKMLKDKHEDSLVRGRAADALGAIGSKEAVIPLIQMLKDRDSSVRGKAADALGATGSKEAVRPLIQMLKDWHPDVRLRAADALGAIGSEKAVRPLIQMLKDENFDVRRSAAFALGVTGSEKAVRPLIQMLEDENFDVRRNAASALRATSSEEAVRPLIQMLEDEDSVVRRSAADALGATGSEEAVRPLIQMLEDEDSYARGRAAEALKAIGSEEAVIPLMHMLKDEDSDVRRRAVEALYKLSHPPERVIFHDGARAF